jgi:hypothetical protein
MIMGVQTTRLWSAVCAAAFVMAVTTSCSQEVETTDAPAQESASPPVIPEHVTSPEAQPAPVPVITQRQPEPTIVPAAHPISDDEQMIDDADAAGMTSRVLQTPEMSEDVSPMIDTEAGNPDEQHPR